MSHEIHLRIKPALPADPNAAPKKAAPKPMQGGAPMPGQGNPAMMGQPQAGMGMSAPAAPSKPLPKKPAKEKKPPDDVAQARKRQTQVLKSRQDREIGSGLAGPTRDVNAEGSGFWPPISPFL